VSFWPGIRFGDEEHAARLARWTSAVADAGLDALVVSDERTTWHLTGFGTTAPLGSTARPRVLLLAADGSATFFVHESTARCVAEMLAPGIEVRGYAPLAAPVEELAGALRAHGAQRVGADLGGGLAPRLAPLDVAALERRAGRALEDASRLIWELRAVKSAAEVERIRRACQITTDAYAATFDAIRSGMTEAAMGRLMLDRLRELGADDGWVNCVSGRGEYDRVDGVPRERPVSDGELVFFDAGAKVGGYWADFSRAGVVGQPSRHQEEQQERVWHATCAGVDALRPGAKLAEVAGVLDAALADQGIAFNNKPGRYGHALGMEVTERPDVSGDDPGVVKAGMVLTIEPATLDDAGIYHCEQDVLVTDAGPEILSLCDWRLRALG
jgi:Xaa-Pro aminopeptidase